MNSKRQVSGADTVQPKFWGSGVHDVTVQVASSRVPFSRSFFEVMLQQSSPSMNSLGTTMCVTLKMQLSGNGHHHDEFQGVQP